MAQIIILFEERSTCIPSWIHTIYSGRSEWILFPFGFKKVYFHREKN